MNCHKIIYLLFELVNSIDVRMFEWINACPDISFTIFGRAHTHYTVIWHWSDMRWKAYLILGCIDNRTKNVTNSFWNGHKNSFFWKSNFFFRLTNANFLWKLLSMITHNRRVCLDRYFNGWIYEKETFFLSNFTIKPRSFRFFVGFLHWRCTLLLQPASARETNKCFCDEMRKTNQKETFQADTIKSRITYQLYVLKVIMWNGT